MILDPHKTLSPETIQAILDLFPAMEESPIDDDSILRVAMGVADAETRRACAMAVVSHPGVSARLARARRQVVAGLNSLSLDARQVDDLRCLAVFGGRFSVRDAIAVFPERFSAPEAFLPFEARGWVVRELADETVTFSLSPATQGLAVQPIDEAFSPGWKSRFVDHFAQQASSIDRTLSELRWMDASVPLKRNLANFRRAWYLAAELDQFVSVEHFVRKLLVAVLELGATEEFSDLVAKGYRAAETLGTPKLRSWLLSFEGVAAARGGEPEKARTLWRERVELNRSLNNPVAMGDALLDIAAQYQGAGEDAAFRSMVDELDLAIAQSGRADLESRLLVLMAVDRLRAQDLPTATLYSEKALTVLSGVDGIDNVLSVRFTAARTLASCGHVWVAYDSLTEVLNACVEGGRSVAAASSLFELANHFEERGDQTLALRCLNLSLEIHQQIGTRSVGKVEASIEALRAKMAFAPDDLPRADGSWEAESLEILVEIARIRAIALPPR